MADDILQFAIELIRLGPADILLMGLVGTFLVSGFFYRVSVEKDCRAIRSELNKVKRDVQTAAASEKQCREEIQEQLNIQNANMTRINYWKEQKGKISKMPVTLDKELEGLVAWCHSKNITVDFERQQASRRGTPRSRRM